MIEQTRPNIGIGPGEGALRRVKTTERVLPMAMLGVVVVLAVVVLPSSLRPPPDQTNASGELSPDAPPEEDPDSIISSFTRAGSRTAGARRVGRRQVPPTPPPPVALPSRGQCFGDPPLQTESVYAPDCKPAFKGDNGGATYKNVTGDQVNIGFWHGATTPSYDGPVPSEPQPNENGVDRTLRVLQAFFNARYETYGRRIQLVFVDTPERTDEAEQAVAAKADTEYKVFASTHLDQPYCDELVRRSLMCFNQNPFPDAYYQARAPHYWGFQMSATRNERLMSEYVCKRLKGRTADYAAGLQRGQPRKFGVIYQTDLLPRTYKDFQKAFKAKCNGEVLGFDVRDPTTGSDHTAQIGLAVSTMQREGVTTIVSYMQFGSEFVAKQAAESSEYKPEWVITGSYGDNFNILGKAKPAGQQAQTFGFSGIEIPRPRPESECYRAYKSIDPNNNPDDGVCDNYWQELMQIMAGIQEAGPKLTPKAVQDGLFRYGKRYRPEIWSVQGGYGRGDHSWVDKMGEVWWDPRGVERGANSPGVFRWTNNGKRFGHGEIGTGPSQLFREGIASAGQ